MGSVVGGPNTSTAPASGAAPEPPADERPATDLVVESLEPSHLALMAAQGADAALRPALQRHLVTRWIQPVAAALIPSVRQPPTVLVARRGSAIVALCHCSQANRRGSCWQLDQLRWLSPSVPVPRHATARALVQEAMARGRSASSWVARVASTDRDHLALLRELGFQPLRRETVWTLPAPGVLETPPQPPSGLVIAPFDRRHLGLLWHLEQSACPSHLRELLDRRQDDLLDQSGSGSRLLLDPRRESALAGLRRIPGSGRADRPLELELIREPAWDARLETGLAALLQVVAGARRSLLLRTDGADRELARWLQQHEAGLHAEEVVMARSVWRRHGRQNAIPAARHLEAMLGTLRPQRTPLPTPLARLRSEAPPRPGR